MKTLNDIISELLQAVVVATANSADNLPPELKRKGRFDEIFCVNLPTKEERESIFKVHISKLDGKQCVSAKPDINYGYLASVTDGFNGADIESVVCETVEKCFLDKSPFTSSALAETASKTISISKSCAKQIESMKKIFAESAFRDANTGKLSGGK